MLLQKLQILPEPWRTWAFRAVQQGPFYSWKMLISCCVFLMVLVLMFVFLSDGPQFWTQGFTYFSIFLLLIAAPSFPLFIYGKYYADQLDLPPLEGKYVPLPNFGYIIMAGIGGFGLIKWVLGW